MGERAAPLRVYIAGLIHETNSFSPMPTSLHSFEADVCYRPALGQGRVAALGAPGYGDLLAVVGEGGDLVVEGPCFLTEPSGPVGLATYHRLRDEIVDGLRAAGAVDVVLLALHGAMMAQGLEDCEADLVKEVRAVVGPQVPVGLLLDLHGNVSPELVGSGAIIVAVKYYPHTDYQPRAAELHAITAAMARGRSRPTISFRSIPCFSLLGTTEGPLRDLVADLQRIEAEDGILSISLMHGFPWADWRRAGGALLVVSEGRDLAAVDALIETLAARYEAAVAAGSDRRRSVDAAVTEALAHLAAPTAGAALPSAGPVVIADSADNPGGGASCDSSFLLQALLAAGAQNAALGMLWDPQAARLAADAGEGARLRLRVGGKVGPMSGAPVDLEVEVLRVRDDAGQPIFDTAQLVPLGLAVAVRSAGIELVINSIRQQVYSPACFTELGIDVAAKDIVVVKSSQHFRAGFDRLARRVIYCDGPGTVTMDWLSLPYQQLRPVMRGGLVCTGQPVLRAHVRACGSM